MILTRGQKVFIDTFTESWPAEVVSVGRVWTTIESRVKPEQAHLVPAIMRARTGANHTTRDYRIVTEGMWANGPEA